MATQLEQARQGQTTDVMRRAAGRENIDVDLLRQELAAGRLVIPANTVHLADNLEPCAIGRAVSCKVNANIGCSSVRSALDGEIEKMKVALEAGADAMMDLSTGGDLDDIRRKLLAICPVPFGTVPIYEVIIDRAVEDIDYDTILKVVEKQARQGVDFFTIHAGLLREHLPLLKDRVCGIVVAAGRCWPSDDHPQQAKPDVRFVRRPVRHYASTMCAFRWATAAPGCIADATDAARSPSCGRWAS